MSELDYISLSHWGMFLVSPAEEQRQPETKKKLEKISFPVVERLLDVRI